MLTKLIPVHLDLEPPMGTSTPLRSPSVASIHQPMSWEDCLDSAEQHAGAVFKTIVHHLKKYIEEKNPTLTPLTKDEAKVQLSSLLRQNMARKPKSQENKQRLADRSSMLQKKLTELDTHDIVATIGHYQDCTIQLPSHSGFSGVECIITKDGSGGYQLHFDPSSLSLFVSQKRHPTDLIELPLPNTPASSQPPNTPYDLLYSYRHTDPIPWESTEQDFQKIIPNYTTSKPFDIQPEPARPEQKVTVPFGETPLTLPIRETSSPFPQTQFRVELEYCSDTVQEDERETLFKTREKTLNEIQNAIRLQPWTDTCTLLIGQTSIDYDEEDSPRRKPSVAYEDFDSVRTGRYAITLAPNQSLPRDLIDTLESIVTEATKPFHKQQPVAYPVFKTTQPHLEIELGNTMCHSGCPTELEALEKKLPDVIKSVNLMYQIHNGTNILAIELFPDQTLSLETFLKALKEIDIYNKGFTPLRITTQTDRLTWAESTV